MGPFIRPWALLLLLTLPLLVWLARRAVKPPSRTVALHPDLALLTAASARGKRWGRHAPALVYAGALALALVALARPTLNVPEANPQAGIVLALDVSLSMQAADITPSRFGAARAALQTFLSELPEGARVGLVVFAGYATTVVPLTDNHERILDAVRFLSLGRGTVIGEALLEGLAALPSLEDRQSSGDDPSTLATIILLSDGRNRGGIDPLEAVTELETQQVTVHTIGVGTLTDGPVPGLPERFGSAARFDETTLRAIATQTGGRYTFVDSAGELRDVYSELSRSLIWRFRRDEATAVAALGAAALLLLSMGWSAWRRRVL